MRSGGKINRRGLFAASGAALAAAAARGCVEGGKAERADVVIIGAGMAGLAAADALSRAGRSVLILEARDRAGGRVCGGRVAGVPVDLGGMWLSPAHTALTALTAELGLATYATHLSGNGVAFFGGARTTFPGEDAGVAIPERVRGVFMKSYADFITLSESVDIEAPWTTPSAAALDEVTLESWARRYSQDSAFLGAWDLTARTIICAAASDVSLLSFATYCRSGGGLPLLASASDGGAQNKLVDGGMFQIVDRLASKLSGFIRYNCAVRAIRQDAQGAVVAFEAGEVRADQVICTLPPTLAGRIAYDPPVSALRDGYTQRAPMGSVIKCWIAFTRPFWRERGFNGLALSREHGLSALFDVTPRSGGQGILAGFFDGAHALRWAQASTVERRAETLRFIRDAFGPDADDPQDYIDIDWTSEAWTRGCFGTFTGTGVLTKFGQAIRRREGRVHFAGTDTAVRWTGHIEGAILAGRRAAAEVIAAAASP